MDANEPAPKKRGPYKSVNRKFKVTRCRHLLQLDAETGQNPALASGHFDRWQKQAEEQLRHLNIQLAQARSKHEEVTANTRLAFGRDAAVKAIQAKTQRAQRDTLRRRVEHQ